jgi:ribonuclease HI
MSATEDKRHSVELHTDGACKGNPGPGGWAFILKHLKTGAKIEKSGGEHGSTNNRMEITAVIRGLEEVKKPSRIDLYSDSEYVVNGINEWMANWKPYGWKKTPKAKEQVKNADLWGQLDELIQRHPVTAHWVRGHDGHPENERCNQLAEAAAAEIAKTKPHPPPPRPPHQGGDSLFDRPDGDPK